MLPWGSRWQAQAQHLGWTLSCLWREGSEGGNWRWGERGAGGRGPRSREEAWRTGLLASGGHRLTGCPGRGAVAVGGTRLGNRSVTGCQWPCAGPGGSCTAVLLPGGSPFLWRERASAVSVASPLGVAALRPPDLDPTGPPHPCQGFWPPGPGRGWVEIAGKGLLERWSKGRTSEGGMCRER